MDARRRSKGADLPLAGVSSLSRSTLAAATELVLLGCFSRFVPEGATGRALKTGLQGMARHIGTSAEQTMLKQFLKRVADPLPPDALPASLLHRGLSGPGRARLTEDLHLLSTIGHLPPGCPQKAAVLVLQGNQDAIVIEPIRRLLLRDLNLHLLSEPCAPHLEGHGHALITPPLLRLVLQWLDD